MWLVDSRDNSIIESTGVPCRLYYGRALTKEEMKGQIEHIANSDSEVLNQRNAESMKKMRGLAF